MRWRARAALTGIAGAAAVGLTPVPASACSCWAPTVAESLAAGHAVAVVTRTDRGPGTAATFAVEDSLGAELPDRLTGRVGDGGSCSPPVPPGGVAALAFEPRDGGWFLGACRKLDLAEALEHVRGGPGPEATAGGRVVAVAAGAYGGSRLAALDRTGRVLAWDGRGGSAGHVAACPGGRTVVAVGRPAGEGGPAAPAELTVHEASTLRVLRAVRLQEQAGRYRVRAMRCADPAGSRVEAVVEADDDAQLVTVEGDRVRAAGLGDIGAAAATADGFVVVADGIHDDREPPYLALIGPDGNRERAADLPGLTAAEHLAVSPDGRTAAVYGYGADDLPNALRTVDLGTGRALGSWTRGELYVGGLAWAGPDRLLALASSGGWKPVRVFDRVLREVDRLPAVPGHALATVGDAAVTYWDTRMTITPAGGEPLVLDELRLAGTQHVAGLPGHGFGEAAGAGADEEVEEPSTALLVGITLSASTMAGAAALAGLAIRRRRAD